MPLHRVRISLSGEWTPQYVDGVVVVSGASVALYTTERVRFVNAMPIPQLPEWLEITWDESDGMRVMQNHLPPVELDVGGVADIETLIMFG